MELLKKVNKSQGKATCQFYQKNIGCVVSVTTFTLLTLMNISLWSFGTQLEDVEETFNAQDMGSQMSKTFKSVPFSPQDKNGLSQSSISLRC